MYFITLYERTQTLDTISLETYTYMHDVGIFKLVLFHNSSIYMQNYLCVVAPCGQGLWKYTRARASWDSLCEYGLQGLPTSRVPLEMGGLMRIRF